MELSDIQEKLQVTSVSALNKKSDFFKQKNDRKMTEVVTPLMTTPADNQLIPCEGRLYV